MVKVTFDSNVWEKLVSEFPEYPTIKEKIVSRVISPYLCEISISLESIQKSARREFFPNYNPAVMLTTNPRPDGSIDLTVQMSPNNETHAGLSSILVEKLVKARDIGFKILPMTNLLTVRSPGIPKDMRAAIESTDAYWAYADRLRNCSEFIESLGCGSHDYKIMKRSQPIADAKKCASAVGEWVDVDAPHSQYALNSERFGTDDEA